MKDHFSFGELKAGLVKKFGFRIDDLTLGSEFAKVKGLVLPIKKIKEVSDEEIRIFFAQQSQELRKRVLDD